LLLTSQKGWRKWRRCLSLRAGFSHSPSVSVFGDLAWS
jgi:hypothetical protein